MIVGEGVRVTSTFFGTATTFGSASRAASPWSRPTRRRAFSRTETSISGSPAIFATSGATLGSFGPSFARASRNSIWSSGRAMEALNSSNRVEAARGSPRSPRAEAAGSVSSGSRIAERRRWRIASRAGPCWVPPNRPTHSRARLFTHQSGASRSASQEGIARGSARFRLISEAALATLSSGLFVSWSRTGMKLGIPFDAASSARSRTHE